nr:hypothetical protein BHI3_15520 [Bacteriovorax sp. HI3]
MKKLFIMLLLIGSQSLFAAPGGQHKINSSSWSLLYGYGKNDNNQNYKPGGPSYKALMGIRWESNVELNLFIRYASQKDDIKFSNIEGDISRTSLTGGLHFGYWIFSFFNVHAGYALHSSETKVNGNYSASQTSTIKTDYNLGRLSSKGLMAGADVVLLKGKYLQLYANYDYYHHLHESSNDWEAMVGIRLYPGPSSGSGSSGTGSFFTKFFDWIVSKS